MRHRLAALASASVFLGCAASASPPPDPAAAPRASAVGSSAKAPAAPATAAAREREAPKKSARIDPGVLPSFARPETRIEIEYPDRARLVRAGRFAVEWPDSDEETTDDKKVDWEPPVIEAAVGAKPYRILCRDVDTQVAVYTGASTLGTVTREALILHPKTNPPETQGDREPGTRVLKGSVLTVLGSIQSVDHLRFESLALTAEGFARRTQLGPTYRPEGPAASTVTARYDLELAKPNATMHADASPTAPVVAKLSPYPDAQQQHRFTSLDRKKNGYSLVRLLHADATVVGWIEDGAVKRSSGEVTFDKSYMTGNAKLRGSRMISLKRGEVLVAPKGHTAVGVVLADHETPCVKRCESDEPIVAVRACGGLARVVVSR